MGKPWEWRRARYSSGGEVKMGLVTGDKGRGGEGGWGKGEWGHDSGVEQGVKLAGGEVKVGLGKGGV